MEQYRDEKILMVISAMGKMTNALEKVSEAFYAGRKEIAFNLFEKIKQNHTNLIKILSITLQWETATNQIAEFFYRSRMVAS